MKKKEWGLLLNGNVFSQSSPNQHFIRIFDLIDAQIYVNANYFISNTTIEINILIGSIFTKRVLKINPLIMSQLDKIKNMIITWSSSSLYVYVSCQLAGQIGFSDAGQIGVLSMPYFKKNAAFLGTGHAVFFDTVRETFLKSACVGPDFVFPNVHQRGPLLRPMITTSANTIIPPNYRKSFTTPTQSMLNSG